MSIKFCSDAYFFQACGSLTSLKSQTQDPRLKVPPGGLVLRIFTSWKNLSTSAWFESRGEHVTPRPPRPTSFYLTFISLISFIYHYSRLRKIHWFTYYHSYFYDVVGEKLEERCRGITEPDVRWGHIGWGIINSHHGSTGTGPLTVNTCSNKLYQWNRRIVE